MELGLKDKVVIVTGGAKGLGKAFCLGFAREGAIVVVLDVDENETNKMVLEIKEKGVAVFGIKADVSKLSEVEKAFSRIIEQYGKIDILINNAGIRRLAFLEETTEAMWDAHMDINLKGTFNCCKAVVKHMKERRYGKIINVSSLAGRRGHLSRGSAYAASKGGVIAFTKSIAGEVAKYNVNVNSIAPSLIRTGLLDSLSDDEMAQMKKLVPIGRVGEPEDLVGLVLLLASDLSSFIHGQTINIDGGQRMD
jgi:NAD(P)-dependent dehydrogenase (short-subunit alcohol dehydrogenase family)